MLRQNYEKIWVMQINQAGIWMAETNSQIKYNAMFVCYFVLQKATPYLF